MSRRQKNVPCLYALKLWREVIFTTTTVSCKIETSTAAAAHKKLPLYAYRARLLNYKIFSVCQQHGGYHQCQVH